MITQVVLKGKIRTTGKSVSRKLRREKLIPAIVYGEKYENLAICIEEKEFLSIFKKAFGFSENVLISLEIEDNAKPVVKQTVLIKDVQIHPVSRKILHVDFYRVSLDKRIKLKVPIVLVGHAVGVSLGGIPEFVLREVEVECMPLDIPDKIEVDISSLNIGDTIHVKDLPVKEGVKLLIDPENVVISILPPTAPETSETLTSAESLINEPERIVRKRKEEKSQDEENS